MTDPRSARAAIVVVGAVLAMYTVGVALQLAAGEQLWPNVLVPVLFLVYPIIGLIILRKRPDNRIGWLCLIPGVAWGLETLLWGLAFYGYANPGTIPSPDLLGTLGDPMWVPGLMVPATLLLMYFPNGTLAHRGWRWLPTTTYFALSGMFLFSLLDPDSSSYGRPHVRNPLAEAIGLSPTTTRVRIGLDAAETILGIALGIVLIGSIAALIARFRRSTGIERQQLKVLASTAAFAMLALLIAVVLLADRVSELAAMLAASLFVLVPVAIGVAITRYRLFDLDRLVSRTVTYGLVVALLGGVYTLLVIGLRSLFPLQGDLPVSLSTLTVAFLSLPLARRVQRGVDRRFFRSRYDAGLVVARVADELRGSVDLNEVTMRAESVVAEVFNPESIGIWVEVDH